MKQKLFFAIALTLIFSLTFAFAACNAMVTEIAVVEGTLKTEYTVGETADLSGAKIKVTFSDGTSKDISLTAEMLNKAIDTSVEGSATYTISYKGATTQIQITVSQNGGSEEYVIRTFELPTFINDYLEISVQEDLSDANFKVSGQVYEVGNANAFLLKPFAKAFDSNDDLVTLSDGLKTLYKVEVSDSEKGTYVELTGNELANFVTVEDGFKYNFSANAANKYVKLTVSLDKDAYIVDESVTTSHTITFKVVENGYNVYDQEGLSVMNDITRPELWAELWGCTVDDNGALQAGAEPLILQADSKPLYQYVGNVNWVVLHGSITIDPDKLPAGYFWDNTRAGYCATNYQTALRALTPHEEVEGEQLNGTLIDGNGYDTEFYSVVKNDADSNYNKGLYNTARVSVSGNYNSVTVSKERSESGRLLKVLVSRNTGNDTENYFQLCQWHVFKMFEPLPDSGSYEVPATQFAIKNVALQGNGGRTESVGPQGVSMLNSFAMRTDIQNVVANGFYTNLAMDNYRSDENDVLEMNVANSKLFDTYNAMVMTWRGKVNVSNCMLKDSGGPLFVVMDGNGRVLAEDGNNLAVPTINVDETTTMESLAIGNESWYAQLGNDVPAMFNQFKTLDAGLQQISGKTFCTVKEGTQDAYISVLSVLIPEGDTALGGNDFNNYKFTGVFDTATDKADMLDEKMRFVTDALAQLNQGTVVIKSGDCYAFVWKDTAGGTVLISYDMMLKQLQAAATGGNPFVDTNSADYSLGMQAMMADWQANSTDTVTVFLQAQTGDAHSPYLGIVLGGYHEVA